MTAITLDGDLQRRLEDRAKANGCSPEDEARAILREAVGDAPEMPEDLVAYIRAHFDPIGGWGEFVPPPRGPMREPPTFD